MRFNTCPGADTLRRVQPWQSRPKLPDPFRQVAVHEAGHIVLMQWVGLLSPEATIAATDDGRVTDAAHWPDRETFAQLPDPGPDESGVLSATAAAVFHAGVMAELIESGTPWAGPVHYHGCTDFQRADEMLRPGFGCHASGAHAYAQQVALLVLQLRWADVETIAAELLRTRRWQARSAKKSSVKIVKIYQARLLRVAIFVPLRSDSFTLSCASFSGLLLCGAGGRPPPAPAPPGAATGLHRVGAGGDCGCGGGTSGAAPWS